MKKCLIIRKGAYGDFIMMSPIFELVKKEGYHITFCTSPMGKEIVRNNPNIDKIIVFNFDKFKSKEDIKKFPKNEDYDRIIDLSGSVEETLLPAEGINEAYNWSKEKRHEKCNVNYYDNTLAVAGYTYLKGVRPELYFTSYEYEYARKFRKKYKDKFFILWSLSGSAFHKAYPYAEIIAQVFTEKHSDVIIATVGGPLCKLLEWKNPQTINCVNKWTIRKSMLMTKYADLVIGTETGVLNAAGCYSTPKIILLSHSTEENLTKYWDNVYPLYADVSCRPCHQLHYTLESCLIEKELSCPICMAHLNPKKVLNTMEKIYQNWRLKRDKSNSSDKNKHNH